MNQPLKVVVTGAGIGGLVLAQQLVRDGHQVTVLERDRDLAETGGYRLHLSAPACAVLRRALEPSHFTALQASAAGPTSFGRLALTDHRLRPLAIDLRDPAEEVLMIGRIQLRALLARGLEGRLRLGARVIGYDVDGEQVVTRLENGDRLYSDVLVGADGPRSVIARQLAGRRLVRPVGLAGIAGRTLLDADTRHLVPELLRSGPALALSPDGLSVFLTLHDPESGAAVEAGGSAVGPELEPPTLVWGLNAAEGRFPDGVEAMSGADLIEAAAGLTHSWHPMVTDLMRASSATTVGYFGFYVADPRALTPWPAGRVVALGDAVHAMPPTGGQGASTAIRDAGRLAARLGEVRAGTATVPTAVADFHRDLAGYAPDAVAESLQPLRWMRLLSSPGVRHLAVVVLPAIAQARRGWTALRSPRAGELG